MKRVLMLAYFFPPIGGGGVQRSAKYAKYLPEFGWEPYVISTTESVGGEGFDPSLMADVRPDAKIWRVPTPRRYPLEWLKKRSPRLRSALAGNGVGARALKALTFPLSVWESPPADPFFWWSLRIIPLAYRLIRRERIDVIYTTSSPWSVTLAGRVLKRLTGKPWVADCRDPWTGNPKFRFYRTGWRAKLDWRFETDALREADRVVTAWPMSAHLKWEKHTAAKCYMIPNGYDAADFSASVAVKPQYSDFEHRPISLVHIGTLYPGDYQAFMAAIRKVSPLSNNQPRLSVSFIGDNGCAAQQFGGITASGVEFSFEPRQSHSEAIRRICSADFLLLLHEVDGAQGKLYEYLAAQKPIVAIMPPDSAAASIVRSAGAGCVAAVEDESSVDAVIRHMTRDPEAFAAEHYCPNKEQIQKYERRNLAGQLAKVLDECASSS